MLTLIGIVFFIAGLAKIQSDFNSFIILIGISALFFIAGEIGDLTYNLKKFHDEEKMTKLTDDKKSDK
jgi:hypothetical protein